MYQEFEILAELEQQINLSCENYLEPMRMMAGVLISGPTFETYVKMLEILNEKGEDVDKLELKDAIQKLSDNKEFPTMEKELMLEYSQYVLSSFFPDQEILNQITSMIINGMAWFFYPFDLESCSQELRIQHSRKYYKVPEQSDLEKRLKKEAKNYIKSEFDYFKSSLYYPRNILEEIVGVIGNQNMYKQEAMEDDSPISLYGENTDEAELVGHNSYDFNTLDKSYEENTDEIL